MPFVPAHRRKHDPLARAQLAPRKLAAKADCANPDCLHRWREHVPDGDARRQCNHALCSCFAYRPGEVRRA